MARSARAVVLSPLVTKSIPSRSTPRMRRRSTRCWCGFRKWWRAGCAITASGRARCRSSCAIRIFDIHSIADTGPRIADRYRVGSSRALFHQAWNKKAIRLLGVYAQSLAANEGQTTTCPNDRTSGGNFRTLLPRKHNYTNRSSSSAPVASRGQVFKSLLHQFTSRLARAGPQEEACLFRDIRCYSGRRVRASAPGCVAVTQLGSVRIWLAMLLIAAPAFRAGRRVPGV